MIYKEKKIASIVNQFDDDDENLDDETADSYDDDEI